MPHIPFPPVRIASCFANVLLLMVFGATALPAEGQLASEETRVTDTGPAVHALCGKRVALLGEPPIHGFGNTLEFKVQLVRRLVEECHYNAFFIESGMYDYVHIERMLRSGEDVADSTISAAIGGLWANKEVQALVPFLREKAKAGSLTLGGLDDQLGAGTYASREMPSDLVQYLPDDGRSRCLAILQRHMLWQYTDDAPYGPSDKEKIVGCLDEIAGWLSQMKERTKSLQESKAIIDSLKRNFARNFTEDDFTKKDQELKWFNDRDRSMYLNFKWLLGRLPPRSKVILWAATVHTAKGLNGVQGFEGRVPLGFYVRRDFRDQAFSLGFSAYSGDYAFIRQPIRHLSDAPPSSLEGHIFAHSDSDSIYLSRKQLREYNSVEARPLGTDFKTAHWNEVVDGLVIFRKERAPVWIHRQNQ
jgi:erythromycin esterase-like protein